MYCIASSIMSNCDTFPDCWRSGNIFFSFSISAWLMLDVSSSTSPIFTPIVVDMSWSKDLYWMMEECSSLSLYPPNVTLGVIIRVCHTKYQVTHTNHLNSGGSTEVSVCMCTHTYGTITSTAPTQVWYRQDGANIIGVTIGQWRSL